MHPLLDETIAAPASAAGAGERAIIRVSGPNSKSVVSQFFTPDDSVRWERTTQPARHTGQLSIATLPIPVDVAVSLWPGRRSYTGQTMAELHLIGSRPIVEAVLESLYAAGARPAQPGEFTQRAFLTGRLDLMQAEAVLGVIDADDPETLRQALRQLEGGISTRIQSCREELLLHLADLEAGLDFVEEDIDFVSRDAFRNRLAESLALIESLLDRSTGRMRADGRPRVVLAGLPNAGKSTLLNALAAQETAIVSPQAGTTRDVITVPVCCDGIWVDLTDTAGIEATADPILAIAQQLGREEVDRGALLLWCSPIDQNLEERAADHHARSALSVPNARLIEVITKSDRAPSPVVTAEPSRLPVSAATGAGIDALKVLIAERMQQQRAAPGELLATSAARCRHALQQAQESLTHARATLDSEFGDEVVSMELRSALDALGSIAGTVYTDDILDRIFSRFCIGK